MLADFQQALADMAASPQLCQVVRRKPDTLWHRYSLSAMEHRRLVEMVNSPGMSQDCALYRANRFAPIALNLPEVCRALGAELRGMVDEYWKAYPCADSNSLLECDRFCRFLRAKKLTGWTMRRNPRQSGPQRKSACDATVRRAAAPKRHLPPNGSTPESARRSDVA